MNEKKDVLGQMIQDDSQLKLKIKKLHPDAILPTRGTPDSAGLDLYALKSYTISAQRSVKIRTGIAMEIPKGYVGLLFARSSLSTKEHLRPANCVGVIDADYRGEVMLCLYNDNPTYIYKDNGLYDGSADLVQVSNSSSERSIEKGDRIAQIILLPYISPLTVEVDELSDTERSTGGFGSTGTK